MRRSARTALVGLWVCAVAAALYVVLFHRELLQGELQSAASTSMVVAAGVYLLLGCVRGLTLVPATALLVVAIPFFAPTTLFLLTLAGILVSAASVYWFSSALHVDELLTPRHERQVNRLRAALTRYELPVIVGWSFFPLTPTDAIGYVCGALRVNFAKYLVGIAIGEGAICALYIYLGAQAMSFLIPRI